MNDTTTTPTTYPTPAADEARRYEAWAKERREMFETERRGFYRTQPADEVIAAARAANPYVPKKKLGTKEAAVNVLVHDAWRETDVSKHLDQLHHDELKEEWILKAIDRAPGLYVEAKTRARKALAEDRPYYVSVMNDVTTARRLQVWADLWDHVAHLITRDDEHRRDPIPAYEAVIEQTRQELLNSHTFRPLSRSTSVLHNLDDDLERAAKAEWAEGRALFGW